jgi:hypothetical protein
VKKDREERNRKIREGISGNRKHKRGIKKRRKPEIEKEK